MSSTPESQLKTELDGAPLFSETLHVLHPPFVPHPIINYLILQIYDLLLTVSLIAMKVRKILFLC